MKHFDNMAYTFIDKILSNNGAVTMNYLQGNWNPETWVSGNLSYLISHYGFVQGFFAETEFIRNNRGGVSNYRLITLANGNYINFDLTLSGSSYVYNSKFYLSNGTLSFTRNGTISITEVETPHFGRYFGFTKDANGQMYIGQIAEFNFGECYIDPALQNVTSFLTGATLTDDPYQIAPVVDPGGGYGAFDYTSDDTDFSRVPTISACDAGFCTLYNLTIQDVKDLADYLWGLGSLASFLPIFSDPMECILSLGIVPVTPSLGTSQYIKVGNLTTTVQGTKVTSQFDTFNMGQIQIKGADFSKSFMDYSPYTKAELFLPYIGTVALDIDEIMDSTLELQYMFDLLSGSCIAELKVSKNYNYQGSEHLHKNVLYRYSGNILTNIPITGANYTQMYQAIIGAVATGIGGAAGAQSAKNAIASEALEDKATLSQISSTTGMKAGIRRAGNLTSACGFMGGQTAELVLSLPKLAHLGASQGKEFGFPRYAEYTLSDLRGFSRIIQVHLKSIKCTDAERSMIETALNGGVIVSGTATPTQTAATNTIKVYSYTCDKICLNKADSWSLIDTITGNWRDEKIDILAPTIKIKPTTNLTQAKILTQANYVYIADFSRYYYITGMNAESGDCITLSLSIDAPMSWLADIKTQKVVVDRQEKDWNTYLSDGYIKTYNTPYCVVKKFPTAFSAENFILAVAGGGT